MSAHKKPSIEDLVEASSLGTPEAKAARESVTDEQVARVVARMKELDAENARREADEFRHLYNAAVARLNRIEELADEWQSDPGRTWTANCGDDLRDALDGRDPS